MNFFVSFKYVYYICFLKKNKKNTNLDFEVRDLMIYGRFECSGIMFVMSAPLEAYYISLMAHGIKWFMINRNKSIFGQGSEVKLRRPREKMKNIYIFRGMNAKALGVSPHLFGSIQDVVEASGLIFRIFGIKLNRQYLERQKYYYRRANGATYTQKELEEIAYVDTSKGYKYTASMRYFTDDNLDKMLGCIKKSNGQNVEICRFVGKPKVLFFFSFLINN